MNSLFYITAAILVALAASWECLFMEGRIHEQEAHQREMAALQTRYSILANETDYVTLLDAESKYRGRK